MNLGKHARRLYEGRFGPNLHFRREMWRVLCSDFFQSYVPTDAVLLEVGGGYCEFVNHIRARERIVVDSNPALHEFSSEGVRAIIGSSTDLSVLSDDSVDVAFSSNFFEHLTRDDIVRTLEEVRRVLRPGGRFLILQPNIRFCGHDYWMFFDHITALDDRSLSEALEMTGYRIVETIVRFLPYTMKESKLPKSPMLVRFYLKCRPVWRILGQQSFIVAEKP